MKLAIDDLASLGSCWPRHKIETYFSLSVDGDSVDVIDVLDDPLIAHEDRIWLGCRLLELYPLLIYIHVQMSDAGLSDIWIEEVIELIRKNPSPVLRANHALTICSFCEILHGEGPAHVRNFQLHTLQYILQEPVDRC